LRHCRDAIDPNGRLLLVEIVLPPGDAAHRGKMLDMVMLVLAPGRRERTEQEYRELLDRGGFRLTRIVPTHSSASVIEATPV
jgi:hypothetical protein